MRRTWGFEDTEIALLLSANAPWDDTFRAYHIWCVISFDESLDRLKDLLLFSDHLPFLEKKLCREAPQSELSSVPTKG